MNHHPSAKETKKSGDWLILLEEIRAPRMFLAQSACHGTWPPVLCLFSPQVNLIQTFVLQGVSKYVSVGAEKVQVEGRGVLKTGEVGTKF